MPETVWHYLTLNPNDLPMTGERVIICVGWAYVGEGWLGKENKWYRFCDLDPVEKFMNAKVVAWREMDEPPSKLTKNKGRSEE